MTSFLEDIGIDPVVYIQLWMVSVLWLVIAALHFEPWIRMQSARVKDKIKKVLRTREKRG